MHCSIHTYLRRLRVLAREKMNRQSCAFLRVYSWRRHSRSQLRQTPEPLRSHLSICRWIVIPSCQRWDRSLSYRFLSIDRRNWIHAGSAEGLLKWRDDLVLARHNAGQECFPIRERGIEGIFHRVHMVAGDEGDGFLPKHVCDK